MDWKDFLRPDLKKVIISVILILFLLPVSIICPGPSTMFAKAGGTCAFGNMLGIEYYEFHENYYYDGFLRTLWGNNILFLLIAVIPFYILSCLMVITYNKIKIKK